VPSNADIDNLSRTNSSADGPSSGTISLEGQLDRTAKAFGKPLHVILLGSDRQARA